MGILRYIFYISSPLKAALVDGEWYSINDSGLAVVWALDCGTVSHQQENSRVVNLLLSPDPYLKAL